MSTAWAWWGYIICRKVTSASLKSVRVAEGAGDEDELPWSIPGMDPPVLVAVELEVTGDVDGVALLLHPAAATARVAAAATASVDRLDEVNMVVLLVNCRLGYGTFRHRPTSEEHGVAEECPSDPQHRQFRKGEHRPGW
jgi:hypothetical protein